MFTFEGEPESYVKPSEELKAKTLDGLKKLFDFYQTFARESLCPVAKLGECRSIGTGPLTELYTEGLDSDQVWEQIEMVNEPVVKGVASLAGSIGELTRKGKLRLYPQTKERSVKGKGVSHVEEGSTDEAGGSEVEEAEEEEFEEGSPLGRKAPVIAAGRKSVVDDKFFKLSEMEKFLERAEKEEAMKQSNISKLFIVDKQQPQHMNAEMNLMNLICNY